MAGKRRFGVLLSLRQYRKRLRRQHFEKIAREMIEAERDLFEALHSARTKAVAATKAAKARAQASIQPPPKTSSSRKKTAA